jgi:phosphatidylserine decarboxylase
LNEVLKEILVGWCTYLDGEESAKRSLTDDQWLSVESIKGFSLYLSDYDPNNPLAAFKRAYVKDDQLPQWGFKSWNAFFSRPFVSPEIFDFYRPMPPPQDNDILSTSDSRVYTVATNVSELDTFWLKGHKYSIKHLLDDERLNIDNQPFFYESYIGGTVFQAYLLPSDYHQWTMPFSGTVKKVVTIPGTYFALSSAFVDSAKPDEFASLVEGLPFLATVSTRKIAIIEADNKKFGTVCFIPVGLQEISTVKFFDDLEIKPKHLNKGEPLGCFQYGGSTVCMVFEPKVNIKWGVSQMEHVLIRSKIAEVY